MRRSRTRGVRCSRTRGVRCSRRDGGVRRSRTGGVRCSRRDGGVRRSRHGGMSRRRGRREESVAVCAVVGVVEAFLPVGIVRFGRWRGWCAGRGRGAFAWGSRNVPLYKFPYFVSTLRLSVELSSIPSALALSSRNCKACSGVASMSMAPVNSTVASLISLT